MELDLSKYTQYLLLSVMCHLILIHFLYCLFIKVGYAGENFPRSIFPSMVGRPILRAEEDVNEAVVLKSIMVSNSLISAFLKLHFLLFSLCVCFCFISFHFFPFYYYYFFN